MSCNFARELGIELAGDVDFNTGKTLQYIINILTGSTTEGMNDPFSSAMDNT